MHPLIRAGYRASPDGTDNRVVGKSKPSDGLIKTPPATLAGQSTAVHVGVVTSQAYGVNQREDSPQGQVGAFSIIPCVQICNVFPVFSYFVALFSVFQSVMCFVVSVVVLLINIIVLPVSLTDY